MKARLTRLRSELRTRNLDGLLVTNLAHVRYLSGFSGSSAFLLVLPRKSYLVTDFRYREQAAAEATDGTTPYIWDSSPYVELMSNGILETGTTIGYQEGAMTVAQLDGVRKALRKTRLVKTGNLVRDLTVAKTDAEVASVAKAARLAARVYKDVLAIARPGMREMDLASEISYRGRRYGSEGDAFDIIVASGPRGALPHGRASTKKIKKGELVTVDFGCTVDGFHSDMTRTFAVGEPGALGRKIYSIVLEAEQQGVRAARPGMTNRELDEVCRSHIRQAGYASYFGHGTGHGLGIDVHEAPGVSYKAEECPLIPGMIVTIEPGIYLPGKLGVRIEDDVVITETGRRVLTTSPRELIVL